MAEQLGSRTPPRVAPRVSAAPGAEAGPPRCAEHGLALAPDGKCTLCRRPKIVLYDEESQSRVATLLLGLCFLLSAVFGVQWARDPASFPLTRYLAGPAPQNAPRSTVGQVAPTPTQPTLSEGELAAQALAAEQAGNEDGPAAEGAVSPTAPQTAEEARALEATKDLKRTDPSADAEAKRTAAAAEEEAARDRARSAMVKAQIEDREMPAARRRVSVVMYGTRWCPYCNKAREHMRGAGIAFTDRDIENDAAAAARHRELNPRGGVPTFDIDGKALVGFDAPTFDAALDRAVAQRAKR